MPFVQVPGGGSDAERAQGLDAADAEDDFLLQPANAITAIQTCRQLAVSRRVLIDVGVEQLEHDAAGADLPDGDAYRTVADRNGDTARRSVAGDGRFDRAIRPIE